MTAILVTGSTGTLGRALVPQLTAAGHEVRAFSRRPRPSSTPPQAWATGDLRANTGLDEALAGIDVVVHCASAQRGDQAAARNLIAAARRAGAPHLVPGLRQPGDQGAAEGARTAGNQDRRHGRLWSFPRGTDAGVVAGAVPGSG